MKINPSVAHGVYRNTAFKSGASPAVQNAVRLPERGENTDQIMISPSAARQLETEKLSKSIADELNKPTSPKRLEELRSAVQNGTYHVSTEKLADALMQRWFGL